MSNTTVNQRNQMERATLAGSEERIRRGSETGTRVYSVIAGVIAIVGSIAAITLIEAWYQWVVLGSIIFITVGFMIAISPNRRA